MVIYEFYTHYHISKIMPKILIFIKINYILQLSDVMFMSYFPKYKSYCLVNKINYILQLSDVMFMSLILRFELTGSG